MAKEEKTTKEEKTKEEKAKEEKNPKAEKTKQEKPPKDEKKAKEKKRAPKPSVDVKDQVALGAEVPPKRDITREVFRLISESADALHDKGLKRGALIVIGRFASMGQVKGAVPPKTNPFEGRYISAGDKAFQHMLLHDEALEDGAVVVDTSGQVLGGRIYLLVDHPEVKVPEGCFARHKAAASTSLRRDVESVITLSEEKNVARVFRDGRVTSTYDPAAAKQRRARKKRPDTAKRAKAADTGRAKKPDSGRRRKSADTRTAAAEAGKTKAEPDAQQGRPEPSSADGEGEGEGGRKEA